MEPKVNGRASSPVGLGALGAAAVILALLSVQTIGFFGLGAPNLLAPLPVPLFVLALFLTSLKAMVLIPVVTCLVFYLWCWQLVDDAVTGARRTWLAFAAVAIGSALWYYDAWDSGLQYQGTLHTALTACFSLAFATGIGVFLVKSRRTRNTEVQNLVASFLLFAWILTYAFPYFGQLP